MKYFLYSLFVFFIGISAVKAQKPITLAEDSVKFGNRYFPGFWLTVPEVKQETVKTSWIKAIQKGTKSKVATDNNEMSLFGAILPDFAKGSVNIMSKTVDQDSLTMLFVSIETSRDNFVSSSSEEYAKLNKYLKKFAKDQYVISAKKQLAVQQDILTDLEKGLRSARKNKMKFEKGIQSSEVRITGQNDNIASKNKELEILEIRIGNSSATLSTMEDGDAKKVKKSEFKDLQKKKKSLSKDINTANNTISKAKTSIEDNRTDIESNMVKQKELGDKIIEQKLVVAKFQQKLKTIEAY